MDVVIFGNGGHGKDMADDLLRSGVSAIHWLDDNDPTTLAQAQYATEFMVYVGINDSLTRRRVAERFGWHGGYWVHRKAHFSRSTIGEHTHVNAGAFLTRCTLGDFVTVGPNATICGDVTIGDDVMIGAGAVIKNLLTIGDGAVIGCGAVVVEDVPAGVTVVGNPARPLVRASC